MAVTPVAFASADGTNSVSISKPTGTQIGDLMVAAVQVKFAVAPTPPSGWDTEGSFSVFSDPDGATFYLYVFSKRAGASEPSSYTFTFGAVNWTGVGLIATYTGNVVTVDQIGSASDGSNVDGITTGPEAPSITPTEEPSMLLVIAGHGSSDIAYTAPSGMTERVDEDGSGARLGLFDLALADTTATGTKTPGGSSTTAPWIAVSLNLYEANQAPNAPTITTLTGGTTVDLNASNRGRWAPSDPDPGDSSSGADIRYRPTSGGAWTDINLVSPNSYYDFPAGTFTADDYEWQVRTYDALGEVGPYSTSSFFTAAEVPDVPSITDPTNGSTISAEDDTITWSTSSQEAYQVRKVADSSGSPDTGTVYYDSGEVVSTSTRTAALTFPTNSRTEHLQVRVKDDGLWSSWASISVSVNYTAPATPTIVVDDTSTAGAIQVQASHPTPSGDEPAVSYVDVWRRRAKLDEDGNFVEWYDTDRDPGGEDGFRRKAELAATGIFTDWFVNGNGYAYRIQAWGDNGVSAFSAWSEDGSGTVEPDYYGGGYE